MTIAELVEVLSALDPTRLVLVSGPPGIGRRRLHPPSLRVAVVEDTRPGRREPCLREVDNDNVDGTYEAVILEVPDVD